MTINVYEIHYRGCWRHLASIDNRISISLIATVRTSALACNKIEIAQSKSCRIISQIVLNLYPNRAIFKKKSRGGAFYNYRYNYGICAFFVAVLYFKKYIALYTRGALQAAHSIDFSPFFSSFICGRSSGSGLILSGLGIQ